jgi:membrane protease YdiL (CAAX protease family)
MDDEPPLPENFVLVAAVFEGGLGVLAVVLGWMLGYPPADTIQWTLAAAGWGVAAALPMLAALALCVWFPVGPLAEIGRVVDELLVPLFRGCALWQLALIAALAGLGEEMLFRGVIQEAIAGWVGPPWGVWIGLAAASILFGLLHPITAAYAALAGAIGFYLGWLWIATGNLLVPITAHAVYDFIALVYMVKLRKPGTSGGDRGPP